MYIFTSFEKLYNFLRGEYMNESERLTDVQMKSASFQIHYNDQFYPSSPTKNVCSFCNRLSINLYKAQCGCNLCQYCIFQIFLQNNIKYCPLHSYKKETIKQEKSSSVVENSESQEQSQIFSEKILTVQKEDEKNEIQRQKLNPILDQQNDEIHYDIELKSIFPIDQYSQAQKIYQATIDNSILCPFNKYITKQQSNCNFITVASQQAYLQQSQHDENCRGINNSQRTHMSELQYNNVTTQNRRGDLLTIQSPLNKIQNSQKQIIYMKEEYMPIKVELITSNYIAQEFYNEFTYQRQDWSNLELLVFLNPGHEQQITKQYVQLQIKSTSKQTETYNFDIDLRQLYQYKVLRFFCQIQCYQEQALTFTVTNNCDIGEYILENVQKQQKYINTLKLNQQLPNYDSIVQVVGYGMKVTTVQSVTEYLYQLKRRCDNTQYTLQLIQYHFPAVLNSIEDRFYKIAHIQRYYTDLVYCFLKTQCKLSDQIKKNICSRCQRIKFFWPEQSQKVNDILQWINNLKNIQ